MRCARSPVTSGSEEVLVEVRDGEAGVRFDWVLATGEVPAILVDAVLASTVALVARGTGGKAAPVRIELARKRRHGQVLREHFRCPIANAGSSRVQPLGGARRRV
jgi:hypothetical protein